jgi:glycosidase
LEKVAKKVAPPKKNPRGELPNHVLPCTKAMQNPSQLNTLFQLNTRAHVRQLGSHPASTAPAAGGASLDTISDKTLDTLATRGFSWVWLLGVWSIGSLGREVSRTNPTWRADYARILPDLRDEDICGSPFAITDYSVDPQLGGDAALKSFRERLHRRGMKLLVDFVPNHVALDHPWLNSNPEFFIHGTTKDLHRDPLRWTRCRDGSVVAFGRDPNFPGWPDTLQLNYFNPALHTAMQQELLRVAALADGARCDMAMLLEPEVFHRTWGEFSPHRTTTSPAVVPPFWPEAIARVRTHHPEFMLLAETYWGYEHRMLEHGFDFAYDKTLYDRLLASDAPAVRAHLTAPREYLSRTAHFLENHDEPRIASKLSLAQHRAAALISFAAPGLVLLHEGQLEGKRVRIPVHLNRGPDEPTDPDVQRLYRQLLPLVTAPHIRAAKWELLTCTATWEGCTTAQNFIAYLLEHPLQTTVMVVNYSPVRGECFVQLPERITAPPAHSLDLSDMLSPDRYIRDCADLRARGLYIDVPAWHVHLFAARTRPAATHRPHSSESPQVTPVVSATHA